MYVEIYRNFIYYFSNTDNIIIMKWWQIMWYTLAPLQVIKFQQNMKKT